MNPFTHPVKKTFMIIRSEIEGEIKLKKMKNMRKKKKLIRMFSIIKKEELWDQVIMVIILKEILIPMPMTIIMMKRFQKTNRVKIRHILKWPMKTRLRKKMKKMMNRKKEMKLMKMKIKIQKILKMKKLN